MKIEQVSSIFKELGHKVRLTIVKEIVKFGDKGLSVGDLQKIIQIPNSTLSHHISSLISVGIVSQIRKGTTLYCIVDVNLLVNSLDFLLEECCIKKDDV